MGINHTILQEICDLASNQVRELYPNLQLMFITHSTGMFHEIIETSEHEVMRHPAGKTASAILEKNSQREKSSFLGMAIDHELKWFGLASKDHILALFNINTDELENAKDARRTIYHLTWHAIDLAEVRKRPEYAAKFRSGPMVPKRSPMNLARLNLQADAFAAIMCSLQGENDAIESLARQRAMESLETISARRAEDYPFCIAMETTQYAYEELLTLKPTHNKFMPYARQVANEIGSAFNDNSIRHWWGFSEPAQDMTWRNFAKDTILGCAIYTSENPFIRAMGHLVAEVTGIEPIDGFKLARDYNAFASLESNQRLHREMIEEAFEEAIAKGIREESGQPLLAAANEQNENLAEGRIIGWCANALQAAARSFENALSNGVSPMQAARLEFEGTRTTPDWDVLKKMGESIIDKKRGGFGTTLASIAEISSQNSTFDAILSSIKVTINDPAYIRKLEAANDFILRGPAPGTPAMAGPSGPAPSGPKLSGPAAAPKMQPMPVLAPSIPGPPGMGGGNSAARMAQQRMMMEKMRRDKELSGARTDDDGKRTE